MNKRESLFFRYWLPAVLWMVVIFVLSSIPGRSIPRVPVPRIDILAHFVEYSILGALWMRVFAYGKKNRRYLESLGMTVALVFCFAATDELHQVFSPGRSAELMEIFLDVIFSFVGIFLYHRFHRRFFRKKTA